MNRSFHERLHCASNFFLLPALLFLKRPVTWFQAVTRHRGSIAYGPNFAYALCIKRIKAADLEGLDLSSWRIAGCGAEPIRPETLEGFVLAIAIAAVAMVGILGVSAGRAAVRGAADSG